MREISAWSVFFCFHEFRGAASTSLLMMYCRNPGIKLCVYLHTVKGACNYSIVSCVLVDSLVLFAFFVAFLALRTLRWGVFTVCNLALFSWSLPLYGDINNRSNWLPVSSNNNKPTRHDRDLRMNSPPTWHSCSASFSIVDTVSDSRNTYLWWPSGLHTVVRASEYPKVPGIRGQVSHMARQPR